MPSNTRYQSLASSAIEAVADFGARPETRLPMSISHRELGLFQGTVPLGRRTRRGRTSSYPGVFASTKCLGAAIFDSLLERDFQTILCADPRIETYAVQAHQLAYWTPLKDGTHKERLYTPDFVVRLRNGRILVMEVKAEFFVNQDYWKERAQYIRDAYVHDYAIEFMVVTERQIRVQPRLSNYERMLRYGAKLDDPTAELQVRDALRRLSGCPCIGEVCEAVSLGENRMNRSYATIMSLGLRGEIELDLEQPLSLATSIVGKPADD